MENRIRLVKEIQRIGNQEQIARGAEGSRDFAMALTFCLAEHVGRAFAGQETEIETIISQLRSMIAEHRKGGN